MKTIVKVIAPWICFEAFELKGLKFIPRAGEYFSIDSEKYPKQADAIFNEEQKKDDGCRVLSVSNSFHKNIHKIYIELDSGYEKE